MAAARSSSAASHKALHPKKASFGWQQPRSEDKRHIFASSSSAGQCGRVRRLTLALLLGRSVGRM
eukprot:scaffold223969_cov30-Tisochrysis_lutea.AAC.13